MNASTPTSIRLPFDEPKGKLRGLVSARCRFYDADGERVILTNGVPAFRYNLTDRVGERVAWSSVFEGGWAQYNEIAAATGISRRALQYWVKRRRAEGVGGLVDRKRSGRPPKVTAGMRRRILRLRDKRLSARQIAGLVGVGASTVLRVLDQARKASEERQIPLLPEPAEGCVSPAGEVSVSAPEEGQDVETSEVAPAPEARDETVLDAAAEEAPEGIADELEACLAEDRSQDRLAASLGKLQDAAPLFAPAERVEWAGMFLAFALLATDPLLSGARSIYGHFRASFYGVRTTFLLLTAMALLRLKRPEHLRRNIPANLGRILGLDRAPEVKTLRRKLKALYDPDKAEALSRWVAARRWPGEGEKLRVVHVDGHTVVYSGAQKLGETWSARCRRVSKGQTENWVNLSDGTPLFAVTSEFNEGLSRALPSVLSTLEQVVPGQKLLLAFDRGGHCALRFEEILTSGHAFVTYRRSPGEPLPEEVFVKRRTRIGSRTYEYEPYERQIELKVYETRDRGPGRKPARRWTRRTVAVREIRILRSDGGQTVILAGGTDLPARELAEIIFSRIGAQENAFKYLRREFDLDGLRTYATEALESAADHPNPKYTAIEKKLRALKEKRRTQLARLGETLAGAPAGPTKEAQAEIAALDAAIAEQTRLLEATPARERVAEAGYKRLQLGARILHNTIAATAWWIERQLSDLVAPHYSRADDEVRTLIAAALRTPGRVRLEPGRLVVRLEPQSEPRRTRAINALAAQVTALERRFPGSARRIVFEPTPCPPPPTARQKAQ